MTITYKELSEKLAENYARGKQAGDDARSIVLRLFPTLVQMLGPGAPNDVVRFVPQGTKIDDASVFALPGVTRWLKEEPHTIGFAVIFTIRSGKPGELAAVMMNVTLKPLWDGRFTAQVSNRQALEVDANKPGTEALLATDLLEAAARFVSEV